MDTPWTPDPDQLRNVWKQFREREPKTRIRDAARALGVTEAQLVALGCGAGTTRLKPEWGTLMLGCEALGRVTAITRNDSVVHEKHGVYANVEVSPMHILAVNEEIDLRLFPRAWAMAFAVRETQTDGPRMSLQVFDRHGVAIHKIYSTKSSDLAAFEALASSLANDDQSPRQEVAPPAAAERERPDWALDVEGFRAAWRALKDTHDFFPLLRRFQVSRPQALRIAEADLAWPVEVASLRRVLTTVVESGLPIMVFVGNAGAIQIHTGPIHRVQDMGPWLNVLDEGFNLHAREGDVHDAWVVRKPTVDGVVTSLELFDRDGVAIAQLFGKRKPGIPELPAWTELMHTLPARAGAALTAAV